MKKKNYSLAEHKNIDYFLPLYGHANLEDVNAVAWKCGLSVNLDFPMNLQGNRGCTSYINATSINSQ